jgi:AcrR family transcriptional regulator
MTDRSVSEGKRAGILDAARAVFSRLGYAGTAMDDVAEEAGIAKGTLYLYFKSKQELYLAALARDMRGMAERATGAMEGAESFREKLAAFLRVRLEYCKAHEDFLRIYLAEYGGMFVKTPLRKELCKLARGNMRTMTRAVEEAVKKGELRAAPAGAVAAAIFDVARGVMERRLLGWKEMQARDEVGFAVELLWEGIGGEKRKKRTH